MTDKRREEIRQLMKKWVEDKYYWAKKIGPNGSVFYDFEMYADYRDELDERTIKDILNDDCPMDKFAEIMDEAYMDARWEEELRFMEGFLEDNDLEDELDTGDDELREIMWDTVSFSEPCDHYLKQDVYINIYMDTGDGNYDFACNCEFYPCWDGGDNHEINECASLLWLAQQQGYTKEKFEEAMTADASSEIGSKFLKSVYLELVNHPSCLGAVVFLVKMTLEQAIQLNELMKKQTAKYDKRDNPDCGAIILDKSVMCGLYNNWNGGGSILEIELEKDVEIPIKFIYTALPDGEESGYGIGDCYGMCGSAWTECVKQIKEPE